MPSYDGMIKQGSGSDPVEHWEDPMVFAKSWLDSAKAQLDAAERAHAEAVFRMQATERVLDAARVLVKSLHGAIDLMQNPSDAPAQSRY